MHKSVSSWYQVTELPFFATKVRLGRGGAEEVLPLGPLNDFER
jgi:malate dehydrogenase